MASTITVLGVIFGISGAKILFLIEEWQHFLRDPMGMAFSPGGLTWYGGFILGLTSVYIYVRRKRVPMAKVVDCLGVGLILAYGVAGCHFSGDGDYGFPTDLPWGTNYENGTYPPSLGVCRLSGSRQPVSRRRCAGQYPLPSHAGV